MAAPAFLPKQRIVSFNGQEVVQTEGRIIKLA